jgi:hypothetical protein
MKVWCRSRVRWERENLYLLPSGDFTDDQDRLHRREDHTAYVTLEDAISAIRMVEEKFLSDKETELQRLESENYLLHKARVISGEVTDIEKNKCITYEKTLEEKLKEVRMDYIFGKSALNILINAISIWNTVYLEKAVEYQKKYKGIDENLLKHISPLNWSHINFLGEYSFQSNMALGLNEYRPLKV